MKGRTRKAVIIFLLFAVVLVAVFIGKKLLIFLQQILML